jgi:hypothetical protein
MRALITVLLVIAASATLAAQEKRTPDPRIFVVTGCVEHTILKVTETTTFNQTVDRYQMRGTKDLMKVLTKDLNGHTVEVTGILKDPGHTTGTGQTKDIGKKTKIYVGQRERSDLPTAIDPSLEVQSFRDVNSNCR